MFFTIKTYLADIKSVVFADVHKKGIWCAYQFSIKTASISFWYHSLVYFLLRLESKRR